MGLEINLEEILREAGLGSCFSEGGSFPFTFSVRCSLPSVSKGIWVQNRVQAWAETTAARLPGIEIVDIATVYPSGYEPSVKYGNMVAVGSNYRRACKGWGNPLVCTTWGSWHWCERSRKDSSYFRGQIRVELLASGSLGRRLNLPASRAVGEVAAARFVELIRARYPLGFDPYKPNLPAGTKDCLVFVQPKRHSHLFGMDYGSSMREQLGPSVGDVEKRLRAAGARLEGRSRWKRWEPLLRERPPFYIGVPLTWAGEISDKVRGEIRRWLMKNVSWWCSFGADGIFGFVVQ